MFLITGNGRTSYINVNDVLDDHIKYTNIENNLIDTLRDPSIFVKGWFSIKDILINDETIYISTNTKIDKNCYNTSIFAADINLDFLKFEEFFTYPECAVVISDKTIVLLIDQRSLWIIMPKNLMLIDQVSGMMTIDENTMLFSIGEYKMKTKAQDPNGCLVKGYKINLKKIAIQFCKRLCARTIL